MPYNSIDKSIQKNIKYSSKKSGFFKRMLKQPFFYSSVLLAVTAGLFINEKIKEPKVDEIIKKTQLIENNVKSLNNLEDFELLGLTTSKPTATTGYLLKVRGYATKLPGQNASLVSLGYEINEAIFDQARLAGTYDEMLEFYSTIAEITKQKAKFMESEYAGPVKLGSGLKIIGISNPEINQEGNAVTFNIDAITEIETLNNNTSNVNLATYSISLPLTEELAKNPALALKEYAKGIGNLQLVDQAKFNLNNFDFLSLKQKDSSQEMNF